MTSQNVDEKGFENYMARTVDSQKELVRKLQNLHDEAVTKRALSQIPVLKDALSDAIQGFERLYQMQQKILALHKERRKS